MTEAAQRRILSLSTWPADQAVTDVAGLLAVFNCDDLSALADYLHGLLPEDPGHVLVDLDGDLFRVTTGQVSMWSLAFPMSGEDLDAYLFELDERATLQNALDRLPDEDEWRAEGQADFTLKLAWLLRTTPWMFEATLGAGWQPVDLDWVGSTSNPSHFFWTGRAVVGVDNCNAYVFREAQAVTDFELRGRYYEEVAWAGEIWEGDSLDFDWFSAFVRDALADEPRGTCPTCGSGDVIHVLFGFPVGVDTLPSWVRLGGCVIEGAVYNRACEACGHEWRPAAAE